MNILVCVKQVPGSSNVKVDEKMVDGSLDLNVNDSMSPSKTHQ